MQPKKHVYLVDKIISEDISNQMQRGISKIADWDKRSDSAVHMDNITGGTAAIVEAYHQAKSDFDTYFSDHDFEGVGVALHTVTDFYSHSNYIPLYSQYAAENGKSTKIQDIPIFADAVNDADLMKYIENKGGLRTGTYGDGVFAFLKDKSSKNMYTHGQMNLDSKKSPTGGLPYDINNPDAATMYDAARTTAQKDLDAIARSRIRLV